MFHYKSLALVAVTAAVVPGSAAGRQHNRHSAFVRDGFDQTRQI